MAKKKRAPRSYRSPGGRSGSSNNMLAQLEQLQQQMEATQAALTVETVESSVGGGMVTVVANGQQEIVSITIRPEVVDPEDVDMLQDLVISAVNQALEQSRALASERMGGLTTGLDLPPGIL